MAIRLHRSNRTERLVEALADVLASQQPADPFRQYPVVVGSRGMERWLRHEIATKHGIAAGLAFPFPRQALAGAARWIRDGAQDRDAAFWKPNLADAEDTLRWERDALAFRVIGSMRSHRGDPEFAKVTRYLSEGSDGASDGPVAARELLFASEVADVLDRMMHDRPSVALEWANEPALADEPYRWLATIPQGHPPIRA